MGLLLGAALASALTVQTAAAAGGVTLTLPDPACTSPDADGHPRVCGDGPVLDCQQDAPGASFEARLVGDGYTQQFTVSLSDGEQLVLLCQQPQ